MSSVAIAVPSRRELICSRLADYVQLSKVRIAVLELVVVAVAMFVGATGSVDVGVIVGTLAGTALVAASASAANQWIERSLDARMPRTQDRPLPSGRLAPGEVLGYTSATLIVGSAALAFLVNWAAVAAAIATWVVYVAAYTPLKRVSTANTAVGAVAGALPVLIGWTAVGAAWDLRLAALLVILFLWQFPHFMAIAWMYRREYAAAGMKMLTVVDPSGMRAACQSISAAALLLPVSLLPVADQAAVGRLWYVAWAVLLGGFQLALAVRFLSRRDDGSARLLLRGSLVYLPSLFVVLVVTHSLM